MPDKNDPTPQTENQVSLSVAPLPIEIGLIVAGRLSITERRLIQEAQEQLADDLRKRLPQFDWRIANSRRKDIGERGREESTELLRQATEERDLYRWDFAIVLINEELLARFRSFALAVLSRPLDSAVISTARLIPDGDGPGADHDQASDEDIIKRISTLMLRALLHLCGLRSSKDPASLLYEPTSPTDLQRMAVLSDDELEELIDNLIEVADLRLEEASTRRESAWRFLLRASYINREQIVESILAARPWQFPRRLSRLTTAAVSTLAVLLMSAESWDLALSQSWRSLGTVSLLILFLTTAFISVRQHLLLDRGSPHREQIAVTRVSAVGIVLTGLIVTWAIMFVMALWAVSLLFPSDLITAWTSSGLSSPLSAVWSSYLKMAVFSASIGILIGALGASFEEQTHFQHVIFVDNEL